MDRPISRRLQQRRGSYSSTKKTSARREAAKGLQPAVTDYNHNASQPNDTKFLFFFYLFTDRPISSQKKYIQINCFSFSSNSMTSSEELCAPMNRSTQTSSLTPSTLQILLVL
uniref:Uncharacterized protein n=1 Tax=Solanum lycopersicum TaxID=4081 RepID=K4C6A9_SOLLC